MLNLSLPVSARQAFFEFRSSFRSFARRARGEALALIPASVISRLSPPHLLVSLQSQDISVTRNEKPIELGPGAILEAQKAWVTLCIPDDQMIISRITVPASVAGRLDDALEFLITQHTPFEPHEVVAFARPLRAQDGAACSIELRYATREDVNAAIARLSEIGLTADAVSLWDATQAVALETLKRKRLRRRRMAMLGLLLSPLLSAFVLSAALSARQQSDLAILKAALAREVANAQKRQALEAKIDEVVRLKSLPDQVEAQQVRHAAILSALARALPSDATIRDLEIANGRGRVTLVASDPFDPMEALSKTELIRPTDASVMSSTSQGERLLSVGFTIHGRPKP